MLPIYCINLDKRPERWNKFMSDNKHLNHHIKRVSGIDGTLLNHEVLVKERCVDDYSTFEAFSNGTLGCALTQKMLWEHVIETNESIVVCEDDAMLRVDFKEQFERLVQKEKEWDLILFGYNFDSHLIFDLIDGIKLYGTFFEKEKENEKVYNFENFQDQETKQVPNLYNLHTAYGVPCYAISPNGAKKLLSLCFPLKIIKHHNPLTQRMIHTFTLDCMMNVFYPDIKSLVCFPPLSVTPNDKSISDCTT